MKNHKRKLYEKVFSIILSIVFVLSSVPAFAADSISNDGVNQEAEDAFSAIGIDTSVVPAGVDLSNNDNPYGKDRVDVIPVYEMFEGKVNVDAADSNKATQAAMLFGDGAKMLASKHDFYTAQGEALSGSSALTTGGYAAFSAMSGNFTGSGQKDKIVTVAAGNWNHTAVVDDEATLLREDWIAKGAYAGLYLYVTDPETGAVSTVKTVQSTSKVIGNIGRYEPENFVDAPYQLQNYLQVATGDFDGDGIDEIAVYVPDGANGATNSNSRIEVYRLKYTNNTGDKPSDNYLNASDWEMAWSYPFKEGTYVSNMVSLLAGDFNRDGTDDLAISWGVYYSSQYRNNSQAAVLYGSKTSNMLSVAKPFDLAYGQSQLVRAAFAYADINGDNVDEVILGAQSEDNIKAGLMNTRVINVYAYNGTLDKFTLLSTDNFDLTTYEDENGDTKRRGDGQYYSSPAMVANITPVRLAGRTKNYMVYFDSVIYDYGDDGLYIYDMMEDGADSGSSVMLDTTRLNDFTQRTNSQIEMSKYYVEYGAANGDFTGNSLESLHVGQYFLLQEVKTSWADGWNNFADRYWWFRGLLFWNFNVFTSTYPHREDGLFKQHAFYATVDSASKITGLQHELLYTTSGKIDRYYALLNKDNDTSFMRYTNKHYISYTDPEVLAVMASAPYFKDVVHLKGGDNYLFNSSTSFTASDGNSTGTTKSDTLSIGSYFGIEQDITVFGVKVASFEMELAYRHDWTWEAAESSSMTQSITYTSIAGQDSVAFYSIPMEIYEYELKTPIVDENDTITGYKTQTIALNIPHNASKTVLSLERYEAIAADYPELPQISGTVLKHTIGDPATYPTSSAGYKNPIEFNSLALVGYGLGSVTQEIEMSEEKEKAYTNTNAVDFKVGGGIGSFKAGVTVGYEGSRGKVTVTTSGSTYAATIVNMPEEAADYQYSYAWKLFTYQYNDGISAFPVVNFIVLDVVEPPKLPQDFDWDSETASNTGVDLTWSYSGVASSFVIYRQYDFSGEKKLVPIATVPASEAYDVAPDGLTRLYKYNATGLSPYQDYNFSIQVERQLVPIKSAKSALIDTRTKTDSGFPEITLSDEVLLVFPDTPGMVSVDVSYQGKSGTDAYKQVLYQWQKKVDDVWTNLSLLSNYTTKTLVLENAGIATAGEYRCRVDVIYYDPIRGAEYYITGYSKPVETSYQKRSTTMSPITTVESNLTQPGLSVTVGNPNTGSVKAPSGNVIFVIRGMDYETSYTKVLKQIGTSKDAKAEIPVDTIQELPEGIYEITAYYNGDRYFRSYESDPLMYKSGTATGYWLELSKNAQYGDSLTPILYDVSGQGANSTKRVIGTGITYEVVGKNGWVSGNTITAMSAGTFEVAATLSGEVVAKKTLTVSPYPLTLEAQNYNRIVNTDGAVHPDLSELIMRKSDSGTTIANLPNGDSLSALGLYMHVENTAYEEGTVIKHNPELGTEPDGTPTYGEHWFYKPGNYSVIADVLDDPSDAVDAARATALANYQITYVDANYLLISGAYDVVALPRLLNGQVRGSIEVRQPSGYLVGNKYQSGTQLKFEAVPFDGYEVKAWYVGNSLESLAMASPYQEAGLPFDENFLNITMRSEAVYVGVEFRVAQLTLVYKPNDALFGKVENLDSPHLASGAVFLKGTEYDFKATAMEGYHFKDWAITGADSYKATGDAIKVVGGDKDVIVQANFERDKYKVHLIGDLRAVYYDDLDGDISTPENKVIALDGDLIPGDKNVTVIPKSGFEIIKWLRMTHTGDDYTFTMLEDTTIEAETTYKGYQIDLEIVQAATAGSDVATNKDLTEFIAGGTTVTLEAKPNYGTVFKGFKINGSADYYTNPVAPAPDEPLSLSANGRTLTIVALGENIEIEAVFENNTARTLKINKAEHGAMTINIVNDVYGTVNNPVYVYDNAPLMTTLTVFDGDQLFFETTPELGFQVIYWKEDKNLIQTMQTAYIPAVISADKSITVDFSAMVFYTVNYSTVGSGTIGTATVDGVPFTSGNDTIGAGTMIALMAIPDPGFMVEKWTVNGIDVKTVYDTLWVDDSYAFVIGDNSDVQVVFAEIKTHDILNSGPNAICKVFEVEPTDFAVGDASLGYTSVKQGAYIKMAMMPTSGYYIDHVVVKVNDVESAFDKLTKDTFVYGTDTGEAWTGEIYAVQGDVTVEVVAKPIHSLAVVLGLSSATFEVTNIMPYNAAKVLPLMQEDSTHFVRDTSRVRMNFTPDTGYKITEVTVTGTTQFTVTPAVNNGVWALDIISLDANAVVTVTTATYTVPNPPNPPTPDPEPTPNPGPVGPVVVIIDDEVPLGISRLEGATLYEIEFVKKGTVSVGTLTLEEFELIVKEVIGQESTRIIFANKDPILTDKLTLTMPKAGLQKFLDDTQTQLEITLEIANLTISRSTLKTILEEAVGDEITLTLANVNTNLFSKEKKALVGRRPVVQVSLSSKSELTSNANTGALVSLTSISPSKWSVELPYTLKKGEDPEKIEVYAFDTSGALKRITGSMYDEQLGYVSFDTSVLGDYVIKHNWISPFKDLDPNAWYFDFIFSAFANGFMKGVSTDVFDPSSNSTKAMIATMLYQLDGSVESHSSSLSDVPADAWFAKGIAWAVQNKIFSADASNRFKPNEDITREQLAVAIYNYLDYKGLTTPVSGTLEAYPDHLKVSLDAKDALTWLVVNGYMSGKGDGLLDPKGFATRAEVAAMFDKLVQ